MGELCVCVCVGGGVICGGVVLGFKRCGGVCRGG